LLQNAPEFPYLTCFQLFGTFCKLHPPYKKTLFTIIIQGDLADFYFMSGEGLQVDCHKVIIASLSPVLLSLLWKSGPNADLVIFPDFCIDDVCGLLNLIYTGRYWNGKY
jgi:hypothetical protein